MDGREYGNDEEKGNPGRPCARKCGGPGTNEEAEERTMNEKENDRERSDLEDNRIFQ